MKPNPRFLTLGLAFCVALAFSSIAARAAVIDRIEASVNNALILLSDIEKFRKTIGLRMQLDPLFAGTTIAAHGTQASTSEITEFLINEKVILQQFSVSDSEVEQEINSIQASNKIDRPALKEALQEQGFSYNDYFELIRAGIAKRNLIDRDIRTKVTISEDDIKNYFYNHYARSSSAPRAYHVKMITISPSDYKSPAAARETAERALKDIRNGEPFEDVARRVSSDPSAKTGGDLGTLTEDQMSPLVRDQLKKLQIGKVSDVIAGPAGVLLLVKLVDVKSNENERYEKLKEEIRGQLAAAEYQRQISLWLDRQRQNAFIHRAGEPAVIGAKPGRR